MKKYLVTGGAGFIGSNIAEEIIRRGHYVRVLDNLSTGKEENLAAFRDKVDFHKGDIRSVRDVKKAVDGIDYVLHQAAIRSVARSIEEPVVTNDVNVNGTLNLLLCARDSGVKRFVYASSSSVYGNCEKFPQNEAWLPLPISPYGVSKLAAEYYCRMFSMTMGLETVCLRYFNVFGPRQNPESMYSAVIPAFIDRLSKDMPCVIHGDGKQSRDFTYVLNAAQANLAACEAPGAAGKVFNAACGASYSVVETADELNRIMNKKIHHEYGPRRPGDIYTSYADVSALKSVLGVEFKIDFFEGLKRTVEWFLVRGK